jgi:adenosylhomocysteine nucleosidase
MSGDQTTEGRSVPRAVPAPLPVDVGIVAAMSIEVGFLLDKLSKVRTYAGPRLSVVEGEYGGKVVAVIVAGMGREAARAGAQILSEGHRPRWIVSAGFAGALDPARRRNDLIIPSEVLDLEGQQIAVDVPPAFLDPHHGVRSGRLLTVDRIIRTAAEKADLRRRFEADAVDMETSGVAALCNERSVRFLSIRVVSDEAEIDLPPEIATLMTRSGSYRVGAALRAIWQRPSRLKDFWRLHEHAQEAADRLAEFTVAAIERLR